MNRSDGSNFAAAVSRALIKQGMRPLPSGTPRDRDGVRVERAAVPGTASVIVSYYGRPSRVKRVADDVAIALGLAGYDIDRSPSPEDDDLALMRAKRAELGSAARPRSAARLGDTCPQCKAVGELWSSYFTPNGDGGDGREPGARYLTMCQDCGTFYDTGRRA